MKDFIILNWAEILVGFMAFAKIVCNAIPSEKPIKVWGWFDTLINAIVVDRRSGK
jgi:hypothetical protein|tara:strand:- start:216 stop:380 length:165 start_codon:yes stop_codon:yes gene_type:complete